MSGLVTAANPRACLSRPPMYPRPTWEISKVGLGYIGGLLKHARGFAAVTNPLINSYKRLVPGYEAPVNVARSEERRVGKEWRCRRARYQAEDGIRDLTVTGVQTCALPI